MQRFLFTVIKMYADTCRPISKSTGVSITTINQGTGIMFLLYGWSTILWQALALQFGKRPVYLVSAGVSVVIMAVAPMCTTTGTYLAIRILQGFFGGPVESLCEISMTDIVGLPLFSFRILLLTEDSGLLMSVLFILLSTV